MTAPKLSPRAYPVNKNCRAGKHNTLAAAQGLSKRNGERMVVAKCLCEHALALLAAYRVKRSGYYRQLAARKAAGVTLDPGRPAEVGSRRAQRSERVVKKTKSSSWISPKFEVDQRMPDLFGGACQDERGMAAMERQMDDPNGLDSLGVPNELPAWQTCARCPSEVFERCARWVTKEESPPGAWAGMYAGLTRAQRERGIRPDVYS